MYTVFNYFGVKKDLDQAINKGKIVLMFKVAKTITRLRIPYQQPDRLKNFVKWFYDNQKGEAVLRVSDGPMIRLFDLMEVQLQ